MTEDQIERLYERQMDQLDRLLMTNQLDQSQYDQRVAALNEWAEDMYNTYNERF